MFSLPLLLSVCLIFFVVTGAEDVTLSDSVSGASAKVLGQSGKIDFYLNNQTMQVTISSLTEVDADGNAVGTTGSADEKHSFNSFASKDFVFSEVFSENYQGLSTSRVNFTCTLFAGATNLQVQLILFLEEGSVNIQNTSFAVERGSFKYTYNIDYWPFCTQGGTGNTECKKGQTDEVGAFLDFEVIMKSGSSSNATVSNEPTGNSTTAIVDWSDGGEMVFPGLYEEVSVSGERVWKELPAGYPLFEEKGAKDLTTLRFTRFDASVEYDPIVTLPALVSAAPTLAPTPASNEDGGNEGDGDAGSASDGNKHKSKAKPKPKPKPKKRHVSPILYPVSSPSPSYNPQISDVLLSSESDTASTAAAVTASTSTNAESNIVVALLSGVAVACVLAIVITIRKTEVTHQPLADSSERAVDAML